MKNLKILFMILLLTNELRSKAQILETSFSHSTIASVKVSYKAVPPSSLNPGTGITAVPEAILNLKTTTGISKIHFKIINKTTNSVVYQVNYTLSSGIVTHENGKKLFERNNTIIYVSTGETLELKPYVYEIQTEDSQAKLSTIFSSIQ